MVTTANYIVKVRPQNGETYIFEYETPDVWTALEEFWHEDWDDWFLAYKEGYYCGNHTECSIEKKEVKH